MIDQFEELFTQVDDETATRFIDELVDVVTAAGTRVRRGRSRCAPTSTTVRCATAGSASCSGTAPR